MFVVEDRGLSVKTQSLTSWDSAADRNINRKKLVYSLWTGKTVTTHFPSGSDWFSQSGRINGIDVSAGLCFHTLSAAAGFDESNSNEWCYVRYNLLSLALVNKLSIQQPLRTELLQNRSCQLNVWILISMMKQTETARNGPVSLIGTLGKGSTWQPVRSSGRCKLLLSQSKNELIWM